ncbi:alpha/beta hydrolase [Brevundimonas sp.]|uniref:alpha/beta hydrolase n=1 Tax=Brevundimonas sp. TaxID=1871086 RepID=UPI00261A87DF|nr:alpha/beta hydrolase [Brevundimonas sp.]
MPKETIRFEVQESVVVGDLHMPKGAGPFPGVVVGGPMTSVRTQVTGIYAAALAERGIAALAIDPRHFGDSGGEPRQYEHAGRKIDDLKAAVMTLSRHPMIDPGRIGAAGVCLGSGYAAWATVNNPQVRALGMVVGYYRDPDAMRASDPEGFQSRIDQGGAAREHYDATGEVLMVPAAATSGDAGMTTTDTTDYYTRRAAVPSYRNELAVMSREHFLPFDVQAAAPRITVPTAMVHSENGLSPAWARKFHQALRVESSLSWIASRGQTDVYDDPSIVSAAADRLAEHFHASL